MNRICTDDCMGVNQCPGVVECAKCGCEILACRAVDLNGNGEVLVCDDCALDETDDERDELEDVINER